MVHKNYFLSQTYTSQYIFFIFLFTLISCNKSIEDKPSLQTDSVVKNPPTVINLKDEKEKIVIDSLKMYAIDNLYFGLNPVTNSGRHTNPKSSRTKHQNKAVKLISIYTIIRNT